jgi:Domain of Unknown Function (DUF1080)
MLAILTVAAAPTRADDYKPIIKDGWEILFDGKNTDAWDVDLSAGAWAIDKEGSLYVAHAGPNIYTKQRYCDYVLELDYRIVSGKKSNSGVFIRVHNKADEVNTGMEIQILDNQDYGAGWDAMNANGAIYDLVHPAMDANKPLGEWNHFRITANGSKISVVLNGKEICKADLKQWSVAGQNPDQKHNKFPYAIGSLPREGFIGLQNYGGVPVWFRNIRLRKLSNRQPQFTGKEPIAEVLSKPISK